MFVYLALLRSSLSNILFINENIIYKVLFIIINLLSISALLYCNHYWYLYFGLIYGLLNGYNEVKALKRRMDQNIYLTKYNQILLIWLMVQVAIMYSVALDIYGIFLIFHMPYKK